MSKATLSYVCQSCGSAFPKWRGQCEACGAWNSLVEEAATSVPGSSRKLKGNSPIEFSDLRANSTPVARLSAQMPEWDRVCGGGLVPASAVLIGGDPGIGKSTLLLQLAAKLSQQHKCAYLTGEESLEQIRMRARRLGVENSNVALAASCHLGDILKTLEQPDGFDLVIIDSIQTLYADVLDSAPGTVAQVRFCAQELVRLAKKKGFCLVLVGHVTKDGMMAGPKVLEHMVDAVLYFEGDRGHQFRILRTIKNRFGATDEIGVFLMSDQGLSEVANPSALFLSDRAQNVSGTAIFAGIEGSRPILLEIQALVTPSPLGMPRRTVVGWDSNRLAMLLAVLEKRAGVSFGQQDVYLNVVGGLKIQEPAADLAVAAALVSSLKDKALPGDAVFFGEIGLSGEVRSVSQMDARLKEAAKLGFATAYMPTYTAKNKDIQMQPVRVIRGLLKELVGNPATRQIVEA